MPVYGGPVDCPQSWEYKDHPKYDPTNIANRATSWLAVVRNTPLAERARLSKDTRTFHRAMFRDLTPQGVEYFSGHYRGEPYFCLENLHVRIPADPRVGYDPKVVLWEMNKFGLALDKAVAQLAFMFANPDKYDLRNTVFKLINLVAASFVRFLTVHPYANGNGHSARFLLNVLLGRFDFWITSLFPVHKRPTPAYDSMIFEFRSGNRSPLLTYLMSCI